MKNNMNEKRSINLYSVLCIVAVVVAMFPISCNYIISGGIIGEWIGRVEELGTGFKIGRLFLFPSNELLINTGVTANVMNSNLCFLLPGLLYRMSGNIVLAYRIFMLAIQIGTALASLLFLKRIFRGDEQKIAVFFGLLLYMTCPYRIYVCYDMANLSQAVAWMLLPLYAWAVVGMLSGEKSVREIVVAAFVLAGIGYADVVLFVIVSGATLLLGLIKRCGRIFVSLMGGVLLFLPGLYRLLQFLFLNHFAELELQMKVIMEDGYRFGEFFTAYTWKDGHPGMGIGMLICLLTGIWLWFVKGEKEKNSASRAFLAMAGIAAILALRYFPWDFVQRMGLWALKFVTLLDTPAVFCGFACWCASIPAAVYMHRISKNEKRLIAVAVPVIVMLFCIGGCIYQCNMLTYERGPITFP